MKKKIKKKRLKVIACIQARVNSTRLKKKVLQKILGRTLIEHIFTRLKAAQEIDEIVLATSIKKENDILVKHARDIGLRYYRGSEEDLVSRFYQTIKKFKADILVLITADCPLVDPKIVDKMVKIYRKSYKNIDFMANTFPPTFPDGLDVSILPFFTLKKLYTQLKNPFYREWMTCYILERPEKFRIYSFKNSVNLSYMRWTVDYPEDLVFVRKIFKNFNKKKKIFTMNDILNFLEKNPQLSKINAKKSDRVIVNGIRSGIYQKLKKSKKL